MQKVRLDSEVSAVYAIIAILGTLLAFSIFFLAIFFWSTKASALMKIDADIIINAPDYETFCIQQRTEFLCPDSCCNSTLLKDLCEKWSTNWSLEITDLENSSWFGEGEKRWKKIIVLPRSVIEFGEVEVQIYR